MEHLPLIISLSLRALMLVCLIMIVHNTGTTSKRLKKLIGLGAGQLLAMVPCPHCKAELEFAVVAENSKCPRCGHAL